MSPSERFSQNFNKLYYSIGEVAEYFGVNTSLIRFWEKEFVILNPKKNDNGKRKFTPKDIEILAQIHDLVKVKGFTLEGAKKALSKKKNTADFEETTEAIYSQDVLIQKLESLRSQVLKLKELI